MQAKETIRSALQESARLKVVVADTLDWEIEAAARLAADALFSGNKILVCGNGGSAADAQHIAAEYVGRFKRERKAWPALALTTDTSVITCVGNDYDFESVFSRQVEGLGHPGDILIGISTSGNSRNVVRAVEAARDKGMRTIALLGRDGGLIKPLVDLPIVVPSVDTARIQEVHITIGHLICELVEGLLSR